MPVSGSGGSIYGRQGRFFGHLEQHPDGSLTLRASARWSQYCMQGLFSVISAGLVGLGLLMMPHPLGIVVFLMGGFGLYVIWKQVDWIGSEFDAKSAIATIREPRKRGELKLPFQAITQIEILSQTPHANSFSTVELHTQTQRYTLVTHWQFWKATHLAQCLAKVIGCPIVSSLSP